MDMLGLKETIDQLATANGVRWYGHVLRRNDNNVLRVALDLEVTGKRKQGRPGRGDREDWFEEGGCPETRQVEGQSASNCRRNGVNLAISAKGITPDKN